MATRVSRKVRVKFKWTKELIILISAILVMLAVTIVLMLPSKQDKFLKKWSAANLTDQTVISEISEADLVNKINNGEYVFVFYGTPNDEASVANIQQVEALAQSYNEVLDNKNIEQQIEVCWLDASDLHAKTDEEKELLEFKRELEKREEALLEVDMLQFGTFWAYNDSKLLVDSSAVGEDNSAFYNVVNQSFGAYIENLTK